MLKTNYSRIVFLAAGFAGLGHILNAADAPNAPVGFLTQVISGGGSASSPRLSVISPTLVAGVEWEGLITQVSANGTGPSTLSVAGNPWAADQFNGANGRFYAEIVSGTNSGYLANISATATSSLVTSDNLGGAVRVGDTIKIRQHVTLADFLGETNTAGLQASDDPSTADEVTLYTPSGAKSYFYFSGYPGYPAGWYDSDFALAPGEADGIAIPPGSALAISRKGGPAFYWSAPAPVAF